MAEPVRLQRFLAAAGVAARRKAEQLITAGRVTVNGELAAKLLAPTSHVPKTYHAKVHGQLTQEHLKQLRAGIELEDGTVTLPADVALLPSESKHSWVAITIHEGKHHQIHRMLETL